MNIIFTICSVNYLAYAKTLQQSILLHMPQVKFVYIIADKIDKSFSIENFEGVEFIEVEALGIKELDQMVKTYNLTEFNTAIKPFAIQYLHQKFNATKFIYLDPDIIVYKNLQEIWENLDSFDFIVTPHLLEPIVSENFYAHQVGALNTGIFNLGFVALNYNQNSKKLIEWWKHHMINHGHSNSLIGEFYDQKIMNLLPIYSDKVLILKDPGYNVAGWNIHERKISSLDGVYFVNDSPLAFYHFSGLEQNDEKNLVSKYNTLKLNDYPDIIDIRKQYLNSVRENNNEQLKNMKCYYSLQPDIHKTSRIEMFRIRIKNIFS
ncbi:MAG: hypothetical protein IPM51_01135 [Sphingobacteriaceae bacterium]|nr:hypothetical protein [Sphingobacteriaceae bacterium]